MRSISIILFTSFFFPYAGAAGGLSSPTLGFAYDRDLHAVRALRGIPGAAVLGETVEAGFPVASASISPRQDFALAVSMDDRRLYLLRLSGTASSLAVPGAMEAPEQIVFSAAGKAALLYGSDSRLQLVAGLPETPVVEELPAVESGRGIAMAVSDDGQLVLLSSDEVRSAGPELNGVSLGLPSSVAALSFRPNSHDLLAVTRTGDVYLAQNLDAAIEVRQVYAGGDQTANPVAIRFSADGTRAFMANTDGVLATLDVVNGRADSVLCRCAPTGVEPLAIDAFFRLTEITGQPLLLFDAGSSTPRLWFVPADTQRSSQ